jgi:hypothetical protein
MRAVRVRRVRKLKFALHKMRDERASSLVPRQRD